MMYAAVAAFGFAVLYGAAALAHSSAQAAALASIVIFGLFAFSFLAPPRLFRYTNADVAPRVMSQVIARAFISSVAVLVGSAAVWFLAGGDRPALLEELYFISLLAILLFHGLGGAVASHVVYLQQTHQYNSNQLVAVLVLVTLLLFVLVLYFLAFDYAVPRDSYVHVRDLTVLTLILLGYGRAVYLMAHH